MSEIKTEIENAIKTTLVVENKQSIYLAVDKIISVIDKAQLSAPNTGKADEWISVLDYLPKLNNEYNVAWDVDGGELVSTTMEFSVRTKDWFDVINGGIVVTEFVKYWRELPQPPKNKSI